MAGSSIGSIEGPYRRTSVNWKIYDYFSLFQDRRQYIPSPPFQFSGEERRFRIYPNGQRTDKTLGWVGLYVKRENTESEASPGQFTIGIIDCDGQLCVSQFAYTDHFINDGMWGCSKYMRGFVLDQKRSEFVPGGILNILFTLEHDSSVCDASVQTTSLDGISVLSKDFHSLLHNEEKSDVTITVDSESFPAHKLILAARSSVFAAMFEHEMKENRSGIVDIEDCEPDIFQTFLSFIYTGRIENLTSDNVTGLFSLADKYDFQDLKEKCVTFMKDNLCLETVCDVLAAADRHSEEELKSLAKEILMNNLKKIMSSNKWILFMAANPVLATELLMTFIPDSNA